MVPADPALTLVLRGERFLVGAGDPWVMAVVNASPESFSDGAEVGGLQDPGLAAACAEHAPGLVLVHTRAAPKVKEFPRYEDVVEDVVAFLGERMEQAIARGVAEESIVLDPGPDFGKTPAQTIEVLR